MGAIGLVGDTGSKASGISVIELRDCALANIEDAGSKAINLSLLMKEGFACPEGFVLRSDAFQRILAEQVFNAIESIGQGSSSHPLDDYLLDILQNTRSHTLNGSQEFSFWKAKFLKELKKEFAKDSAVPLVRNLVVNKVKNLKWTHGYARSSANVEDRPGRSYAGMLESEPFFSGKLEEVFTELVFTIESKVVDGDVLQYAIVRDGKNPEEFLMNIKIAIIFEKMEEKTPHVAGELALKKGSAEAKITHGLGEPLMKKHPEYEICEIKFDSTGGTFVHQVGKINRSMSDRYEVNEVVGYGTIRREYPPDDFPTEGDVLGIASKLAEICTRLENSPTLKGDHRLLEFVVWRRASDVELLQFRNAA